MAARAKRDDPFAVRRAIFLRPFFHVIVAERRCRVATVATCARDALPEMHVVHDLAQVHVRRRAARGGREGEEGVGGVIRRIAVAKDAVVLQ